MLSRVSRQIEVGRALEARAIELASAWPYDEKTDQFSDEVKSHYEPFGELGTDIERWFNEVKVLAQGLLAGDTMTNYSLWEALGAIKTPWHHERDETRSGVLETVRDSFKTAFRLLHTVPSMETENVSRNVASSVDSAFILMWMDPARPELEDVSVALKEVFSAFGIDAVRADDIEHQDVITALVLQRIRTAEFLVADLSGERPNVYYEVGYAHAIGKRPILYRRAGTPLHFDLSVHNVPEYRNITELKDLLRKRLEAVTGRLARQGG